MTVMVTVEQCMCIIIIILVDNWSNSMIGLIMIGLIIMTVMVTVNGGD